MTSQYLIRAASPSDVDTILSLIRALAEYERLSHEVVATPELLCDALFGSRPVAEAVIGEVAREAVGVAIFFTNFSTFLARPGLYLEDLFVKPTHRGKGYGKALLHYLAKLAVQRGYGRFEWTVLDWNESAIEFYRAQGAAFLPDWRICRVTGEALVKMSAVAG